MKKTKSLVFLLSLVVVVGCGSSTDLSKDEEAKLRENMAKKHVNINDVPEKDRDRVRAIMQANGFNPETGQPTGQGAAPSAPK